MKNTLVSLILLFGLYLGLHNGYIALFHTDETVPVTVFPHRAELYPREDRDALRKGIPVRDRTHLEQLLEDYLS